MVRSNWQGKLKSNQRMSIKGKPKELELCLLVSFPHSENILKVNKEIKFIGAHHSGGLKPWSLDPMALGLWQHCTSWQGVHGREMCPPHGSQEAKMETGRDQSPNNPTKPSLAYPNDLTSHVLKLLPPLITPQAGGQAFDIWAFGGHLSKL